MPMKLYGYFRSSATYRARIALNYKGVAYESVAVDLRAPVSAQRTAEFLALNPEGLVPVLVDGDTVVRQSLAIIEYLEETHPAPPLLPQAPAARAQVRALTLAIACDIHPLNNLRVLNYLRDPLAHGDADVHAWYAHWIACGFTALEQEVRDLSGDGRHMFGNAVTVADVFMVPQMANARRERCDVEPYPRLRAICEYLESLPVFARAAPQAQSQP
jgi:maleylpyruvate isomerase